MSPRVVAAGPFWTGIRANMVREPGYAVCMMIRWFTRPGLLPLPLAQANHMGLWFRFEDGSRVIHEARAGGYTERPFRNLLDWYERGGFVQLDELSHWPEQRLALLYSISGDWVGSCKGYGFGECAVHAATNLLALRALGLSEPIRRGLFRLWGGSGRVMCSEAAARLLWARDEWLDLRDRPGTAFDAVTPEGARIRWGKIRESFGQYSKPIALSPS